MPADQVLNWLDEHERESIDRLVEWLRIPSVSTDPAYREEVRQAGSWAAEQLAAAGFAVEVHHTGDPPGSGHPVVLAHTPGKAATPHVLFYGHYDVQPADPLDLWESPPFEPVVKNGPDGRPAMVVARGASDDKGQVLSFLEAMRAWKEAGGETAGGVRMTVLLEGEEESSSVHLPGFVEEHADQLRECDICVISDTGMLGPDSPAITYGVRGLAYTEVVLHGPNRDLHSGLWGGRVPNPVNELVKVLGQVWDDERRVTIPGFYEGVRELTAEERKRWKDLPFDQIEALRKIGMSAEADVGEAGFAPLEREWARPTCDINGIVGGYTGAGAKTVIAAKASAKVSFRLVDDQDPEKIRDAFFAWLRERTPPGCRWELIDHGTGLPATVATDSPYLEATRRALKRAAGKDPALIKSGGSIPVAGLLKETLGIETIFMGFGLDDDRVHSPNEKFDLACLRLGARAHALLIDELRRMRG